MAATLASIQFCTCAIAKYGILNFPVLYSWTFGYGFPYTRHFLLKIVF